MDKCRIGLGYNVVPPPYTRNFMPLKSDLVYPSLDDFVDVNVSEFVVEKPTVKTNEPETSRKENGAPIIEDWVSDSDEENVPKVKTVKMFNTPSFAKINFVKSTEQVKSHRKTSVDNNRKNIPSPRGNKRKMEKQMKTIPYSYPIMKKLMEDLLPLEVIPKEGGSQIGLFVKAKPDESNLWHRRLGHKTCLKLPFECLVTILNTIDHLGKFDGKTDVGFFIGYSSNSKAFRVFNNRTRIVEENPHVQFSGNTPNIAGSGPNWLFDIDALTKSMNYKPVVAGNQSNGNADIKACNDARKTRMEIVPGKDYILLLMWPTGPLFSQDSKSSPDARFKLSGEEEKKDTEDPGNEDSEVPSTEETRVYQEKDDNVSSTKNVNTASNTINTAHDAALDDDVVLVKRCGFFFLNWSSRSHVNSGPLLEFHRTLTNGIDIAQTCWTHGMYYELYSALQEARACKQPPRNFIHRERSSHEFCNGVLHKKSTFSLCIKTGRPKPSLKRLAADNGSSPLVYSILGNQCTSFFQFAQISLSSREGGPIDKVPCYSAATGTNSIGNSTCRVWRKHPAIPQENNLVKSLSNYGDVLKSLHLRLVFNLFCSDMCQKDRKSSLMNFCVM
ncbi:ribonuclease H-like domain-containing protein [Tanacetum coccineum]|uniref:Ribonuclease H-like domain-containing protein n=1 Tax=Tanacetum coccineum TaxID=301880 RepID=A0ABQ4XQR0_9ASTR